MFLQITDCVLTPLSLHRILSFVLVLSTFIILVEYGFVPFVQNVRQKKKKNKNILLFVLSVSVEHQCSG